MKFRNKVKQISGSWYFLMTIIFVYILLLIFYRNIYFDSFDFFFQLAVKIVPVVFVVFVVMSLSNYFITPDFVMKHLREKGFKKWFYVIVGGVLSTGPIYM